MPAISPPDNPFPVLEPAVAAVAEAEVAVDVTVVVASEIDAVIVGNTTPTHLESALEL
jgi:hypothetical protein